MNYLVLAAGGAIGTVLRYILTNSSSEFFKFSVFPWGTFIVNLSGSLIIGILAGINDGSPLNQNLRFFLFAGLLGGFTTFSAFSLETLQLIRQSQLSYAFVYVLSSSLLGIALAATGFFFSRALLSFLR